MEKSLSRRERDRQARQAEIVEAAEQVFFAKGYDGASMEEIAQAAHFTKRTVYQHFTNKDDLYFAVAFKWFERLFAFFEAALGKGANGYEKFRLSGLAYYQFSKDYPLAFRLLNHCNIIKADQDSSASFRAMMEMGNRMFQNFAATIEEGQRDGSIREDLDAKMGAHSAVYLSIGYLHLVTEKGENIQKYHGIDQAEFMRYGLDLLCAALRNIKKL